MSFTTTATRSNDKPLKGENIAILVGSGFNESELMQSMRALMDTGAKLTLVGVDAGLVQGWTGTGFGHSHAVDLPLSNALAADFSLLLIPGGQRSMDKLKNSAHVMRFIKGFLSYGNPAAFLGDAVQMVGHVGMANGMTVTGPASQEAAMVAAGATWVDVPSVVSEQIITGKTDTPEALKDMVVNTVAHFMTIPAEMRLAA